MSPGTHSAPSVMKNNLSMNASNHVQPSTSYVSNHTAYTPSPTSPKSNYSDASVCKSKDLIEFSSQSIELFSFVHVSKILDVFF